MERTIKRSDVADGECRKDWGLIHLETSILRAGIAVKYFTILKSLTFINTYVNI
jgi:hypothetical protein